MAGLLLFLVLACESPKSSAILSDESSPDRLVQGAPAVVQILVASADGLKHGSGFVIDPSGVILTTSQVLQAAQAVLVKLPANSYYRASILATDPQHGTAALKVDARRLPSIELANSDVVPIGSRVTALGKGSGLAVSTGLVESLQFDGYYSLRLPAPLSRESSGGPVLNEQGAVIGMAVSRVRDGRTASLIIPNTYMRDMLTRAGVASLASRAGAAPGRSRESVTAVAGRVSVAPGARNLNARVEREPRIQKVIEVPARTKTTEIADRRLPSSEIADRQQAAPPVADRRPENATRLGTLRVLPAPTSEPPGEMTVDDGKPAREAAVPEAAPEIDLTGEWNLINTIQESSYSSYDGLRLGFRVSLEQVGRTVVGSGEKVEEDGRLLPPQARSPIRIEGVLRNGKLRATFIEQGARKTITGSFDWKVLFDGRVIRGRFSDSAATSRGSSIGVRVD